ncbi:MAG: hypothetical protein H6830_11465 [Planctomycetes bacterium]|nr:hypothetical protein [Planctomycetota bacterium]MCB9908714.1 hypothetical protein [Planctomycetota bacterium]
MLALWAALVVGLQAAWIHRWTPLGGPVTWFYPDWTLVLLVAVGVRLPQRQVGVAAAVLGMVRLAYSGDAPTIILAGYGWVALAVQALRSGIDVSGPLPRTLLAFVAAVGVSVWCQAVQAVRHPLLLPDGFGYPVWVDMARRAFPAALITALIVGLLGVVLSRLPGLSPLYQRPRF